jgi:hypothetical protein
LVPDAAPNRLEEGCATSDFVVGQLRPSPSAKAMRKMTTAPQAVASTQFDRNSIFKKSAFALCMEDILWRG